MSPFSKTTLDINKLYVSSPIASKIPDDGEDKKDKVEDTPATKQGQSTTGDPQQIITALIFCNDVLNNQFNSVMTQISLFERKVTMIQTRVMKGTQKPLPPSHQPPRKTSNAKTPQVHYVLKYVYNFIVS